jgi:hypothetical protein
MTICADHIREEIHDVAEALDYDLVKSEEPHELSFVHAVQEPLTYADFVEKYQALIAAALLEANR